MPLPRRRAVVNGSARPSGNWNGGTALRTWRLARLIDLTLEPEPVAGADQDDALERHVRQRCRDGGAEILEDDQDARARIVDLLGEFAGRVERVDVDHRAAGRGARRTDRHRVGRHVRQHDRDAVALRQTLPRSQAARARACCAEGRIGQGRAEARASPGGRRRRATLVSNRSTRVPRLVDVDLGRDPRRVGGEPGAGRKLCERRIHLGPCVRAVAPCSITLASRIASSPAGPTLDGRVSSQRRTRQTVRRTEAGHARRRRQAARRSRLNVVSAACGRAATTRSSAARPASAGRSARSGQGPNPSGTASPITPAPNQRARYASRSEPDSPQARAQGPVRGQREQAEDAAEDRRRDAGAEPVGQPEGLMR